MRFDEEKIKQAILHREAGVRPVALHYFACTNTKHPTI